MAQHVICANGLESHPSTQRSYALDQAVTSDVIAQIDLDLPRSHSENPLIRRRLGVMRAMLLQHVAEDPELNYCQGMSFVAAAFAVAIQSQAEAYRRFHRFIQRMRGLWLPGFPLLHEGTSQFEEVARNYSWFQQLEHQGLETSMYLPQAWMTLFANWLPLDSIVRCLPQLEETGFVGVMAMTLAVLDNLKTRLVQATGEEILVLLKDPRHLAPQAAQLSTQASAWAPVVLAAMMGSPSSAPVPELPKRLHFQRMGSCVVADDGEGTLMPKTWSTEEAIYKLRAHTASAGAALFAWALGDVVQPGRAPRSDW